MIARLLLAACACAALLLAGPAAAGEKDAAKPAAAPAAAEKGADAAKAAEAAAMEQWMKLNAPGEAHKMLAGLAGDWAFEVKSWMAPGAPPSVSKGSASSKMILGGRYLREEVTGNMMDMTFEGVSTFAYDNVRKKYVGTWMDSMSTGIFTSEGTYDPASKSITMTGTTFDPMANKDIAVRTVTRIVDDNKHVFEWYQPGPDGKEMMSMEITYTRK